MRSADSSLRLLGVDAASGRPLELPTDGIASWARSAARKIRPPRFGVVLDDLASAGWGVVFAETVDPAILEALRPLLDHRREQAGDRYRELKYRPDEDALAFRARLRSGIGRVEPRELPWPLLLVGSPHELPHAFELDLGVPHAVGRVAFDTPDDAAAWAERVVRAEEREPMDPRPWRSVVVAPAHGGDRSTRLCVEHLGRPIAQRLGSIGDVVSFLAADATREHVLTVLGRSDVDLFVFAGHGLVYDKDRPWQSDLQGSWLLADWPGPDAWPGPIPLEHAISTADFPTKALDGAVAVLFGCHTAGTPEVDPFDEPTQPLRIAHRPFVSGVARRLLGRSGGALAVLGHVGRAFEAAFFWRGARQIGPLDDAVRALLDGRRLGEAIDGFGQRFAELAVAWSARAMQGRGFDADHEALDLWIAFHDARSWTLLGDPASRLARARPPR